MKPLRVGFTLILVVVLLAPIPTLADDDDDDACWVEYAPGEVRDFHDLEDIDHRDGSRTVNYVLRSDVINEYYEDEQQAEKWVQKVIQQLRGCN